VDPELLEANIAMFQGLRVRVLALINALPLAKQREEASIWLLACAQDSIEERNQHLRTLVESFPEGHYGRMAKNTLDEEDRFAAALRPRHSNLLVQVFGVPWWVLLPLFAVILVIAYAIFVTVTGVSGVSKVSSATRTPAIDPTYGVVIPPDLSVTVPPGGSFSAEYGQGLLRVVAIENDSRRVIAPSGNGTTPYGMATPVKGARFYALRVNFECRLSICKTPPEADLAVKLADGNLAPLRPNVLVPDGQGLSSVAQGVRTEGWIVFEVPQAARVSALVITPHAMNSAQQPQPITITLPPPS
jgi:hypothetical protein